MTTLTPYLMFNGNCAEALDLYTRALGGEIVEISHFADAPPNPNFPALTDAEKQRVMHARIKAGELLIMASDSHPHTPVGTGQNVTLSLGFDSIDTQRTVYEILSEGADITMPLADTFWGAHFAMLTDRYGISWMLNYDYPKAS